MVLSSRLAFLSLASFFISFSTMNGLPRDPQAGFRTLGQGSQGPGIPSRTRLVIRDARSFEKFWNEARKGEFSDLPAERPPIDFNEEMVVVVSGDKNRRIRSGIEILGLKKEENRLVISIRNQLGFGADEGFRYPYHIAAIPRFDGEIIFRDQ